MLNAGPVPVAMERLEIGQVIKHMLTSTVKMWALCLTAFLDPLGEGVGAVPQGVLEDENRN